ncbi:endolytic transglycosylase MltG [Butyrivibrio sp. MC2013]|uniref:endolytic transglycosylase MltG n=1 Tax=Butyrivibrio sp. MC2013 TaxID=1280686 RepID=UPI0003FDCADE|nr:endolytic transglycosylase MltG [Butyrivibrio sp. MC2013]
MNVKEVGISTISAIVRMVCLVIAALFILQGARMAYSYGRGIFNQTAMAPEGAGVDVTVTVSLGESVSQIADDLYAKRLIGDKTLFRLQELLSEYHGKEQAGVYVLNTSMTPDEILAAMAATSAAKEQ